MPGALRFKSLAVALLAAGSMGLGTAPSLAQNSA
jgi:hypothetical protein